MELAEWRVLGARPIGAYRLIHLEPPQPAAIAPGQFVMVRDPNGSAFLPRPVGPFAHPDGGVGVLVDPAHSVGALADARVLRVLGPLGRGFDAVGAVASRTLLVAGGIGFTVFPDVPRLIGGRPRLIAGFRTEEQARVVELIDADSEIVVGGSPIGAVERALGSGGIDLVLVAGPTGLARAVGERVLAAGIACQLALEAPMACGFGSCFGCAVELDGTVQRLCVEGPVVDARRVLR